MLCEFLNSAFRVSNRLLHACFFYLITAIEYPYLILTNVRIGRKNIFKGWCSCFKWKNSVIIIGKNNKFNSCGYTNHIGLNHRCILTTMSSTAILQIGDNCGISSSTFTAFDSIKIGNNVRIGANCIIMDADFHVDDPRVSKPQPIVINDNVWLGGNVTVMKGVTIGKNSLIGINSLVTKDIPENVIAAGNPCKVIRKLKESEIQILENHNNSRL